MISVDGVSRSLASISPYPWAFDGTDVLDRNREPVAARKGFQRVGDLNALFIATAPTVIEQLASEVERLRGVIKAAQQELLCNDFLCEPMETGCPKCHRLYLELMNDM